MKFDMVTIGILYNRVYQSALAFEMFATQRKLVFLFYEGPVGLRYNPAELN